MMGDTAAVPLMDDMEEEVGVEEKAGLEAGLAGDFAYNNNVAGASKHVRLGAFSLLWKSVLFSGTYTVQGS